MTDVVVWSNNPSTLLIFSKALASSPQAITMSTTSQKVEPSEQLSAGDWDCGCQPVRGENARGYYQGCRKNEWHYRLINSIFVQFLALFGELLSLVCPEQVFICCLPWTAFHLRNPVGTFNRDSMARRLVQTGSHGFLRVSKRVLMGLKKGSYGSPTNMGSYRSQKFRNHGSVGFRSLT